MASAATNPAGNFSAAGNGGAGQTVTCAGGSQAILEEDLVRWLQQRKGARMRRQAVLTKVLSEDGDAKGRRLARLFALQAHLARSKCFRSSRGKCAAPFPAHLLDAVCALFDYCCAV